MSRSTPSTASGLRVVVCTLAVLLAAANGLEAQAPQDRAGELFARWSLPTSPGCAVGVDRAGASLLRRAYGMADLEWNIENTPETIFENGSVSKQFTAGAIVLLALDGKLSLEDDVRQYVPELPAYAERITLRHMLNHTSGLRDWGAVAAINGWGRSLRTHSHEHVLDILSRQSALNFEPGHEYSYSNSGYNLLAIIVGRVSGMSFADFSQQRIFGPLGMKSTQWRDDYTRIVPGRSAAYTARANGSFAINRPIENVHGNGGLLTTVGDLLLWNRSLDEASLAGPEFVEMMETQGVLNDGTTINYALGLSVGEAFGQRHISHGGATSGYRAGLVRFPDQELGVAVLCNVTNANGMGLAMDVAEIYLGDVAVADNGSDPDVPGGYRMGEDALSARAGSYVSTIRPANTRLTVDDGGRLRMGGSNGRVLIPRSTTEFEIAGGESRVLFDGPAGGERTGFVIRNERRVIDIFAPAGDWKPTVEELAGFEGFYESDDADVSVTVAVENNRLVLNHPLRGRAPLTPLYDGTFRGGPGMVRFRRLVGGQVHELSMVGARVYDMRFRKTH